MTDFATQLLKDVGNFVGIEEVRFNEEGFCVLQLQDQFAFILRHDQESERLVMIAEFARPEQISQELFSSILSFHFLRIAQPGPWIAYDQETKALCLADEFFLQVITKERFQERLEYFFENYLNCQGLFSAEAIDDLLEKKSLSFLESQKLV